MSSPNPLLQAHITPLSTQGRSFLQHRSLPLKGSSSSVAVTAADSPTLHSLLMRQVAEKVEKPKRKKVNQVSDASDVAAEAMRITRESIQKEELKEIRPNGGKLYR